MPQSPEQNPDQPQEVEAVSIVLVEAPTDVAVVETPTDVAVVETSDSAPTAAASPKPLDLDPAFCAALIKQQFPALFGDTHKPIKLRIQADIQASLPGVFSKPVLSGFLHRYTGSTPYLIALTRSQQRFDLFGEPAGELAAEHVEAAKLELERRRQLRQQRIEQERAKRPPREQVPARPQGALAGAAQDGVPRQANDRPQQERANDRPQQERANDRPQRGPRPGQEGRRHQPAGRDQYNAQHARPNPDAAVRPEGPVGDAPLAPGARPEPAHRPPFDPRRRQPDRRPDRPPQAGRGPGQGPGAMADHGARPDRGPRPDHDARPDRSPRPAGTAVDMPRATSHNNSRNDVRSDTRNDARSDIRNDSRAAPRPAAPDPRDRHEHFPADPARQARAKLLRDFEQTTLTASNFCALKRLTPADLQAQLTQARSERGPLPGNGRKNLPGQPQP